MIALIDSDTPVFAAALSAEDADESWVATSRFDKTIENLLLDVGCKDFKLFVSSSNNFRNNIDGNYKANRSQPDPKWRKVVKEHAKKKWGAIEVDGIEADDLCGIYQNEDSIICGIDKDLLQIPGKHFSWEIKRKGETVRPATCWKITEVEGLKNFYKQMLIGDTSDNIIGVDGIGPKKASKIIDHLDTEEEMREVILNMYNDVERFNKNANLLWIMRNIGEIYESRL